MANLIEPELNLIEPLPMSLREAWALWRLIENAANANRIEHDDREPIRWLHERLQRHVHELVEKRKEAITQGRKEKDDV